MGCPCGELSMAYEGPYVCPHVSVGPVCMLVTGSLTGSGVGEVSMDLRVCARESERIWE